MRYMIFVFLSCLAYGNPTALFEVGEKVIFNKKDVGIVAIFEDRGFFVTTSQKIKKKRNIILNLFDNNGSLKNKFFVESNVSQTLKAIEGLTLLGMEKIKDRNNTIFLTKINLDTNISETYRYEMQNRRKLKNFLIEDGSYFVEYGDKNCDFELMKLNAKAKIHWESEGENFSKNRALIFSNKKFTIVAKERVCKESKKKRESILLYRVNNNSAIVWQKNFESDFYSVKLKSLNFFNQHIFLVTQNSSRKKRDITQILKIDRKGDVVFKKEINYKIDSLEILRDGNLLIYGKTFNNLNGQGQKNIVAKFDKNFKLIWLEKIDKWLGKIVSMKLFRGKYIILLRKKERRGKLSFRSLEFNQKYLNEKKDRLKIVKMVKSDGESLRRYLENHSFDLNKIIYKKKTLLTLAIENNNLQNLKILLEFGLKVDKTKPINSFSHWYKFKINLLEFMLNQKYTFSKKDKKGYTPIALSIVYSNISLTEFLIAQKQNIDEGTGRKNPLILSIITKNRDIFDILIASGAKTKNIKSSYLFSKIENKGQKIITLKSQNENLPDIPILGTYLKIVKEKYETRVFFKNKKRKKWYLYEF